ncbi:MAG: TatD family hydrolase [Lewinellaceae bacterium]|nr:TatD family hydrolase [Lewinellaceae bacterium]
MRDFINIHTHHPTQLAATMEIESVYWGQSRIPSAEWLSVGLHPWYLKDIDWLAAEQWLREMAQNSRVVAVGEAGLDKACASDWETQPGVQALSANGRRTAKAPGNTLRASACRSAGRIAQFPRLKGHFPWL